MKTEEFTSCCRYYSGEESPQDSEFWSQERIWVKAKLEEQTRSLEE